MEAEVECNQNGGHLVSILDFNEMSYIHYMLTTVWKPTEGIYIGE